MSRPKRNIRIPESYIKDIQKCNTKVSPIKGHNIKGKKITHKAGQTKAPESLDT